MSPRRTDHTRGALFRLGQTVATPGAIEVMERLGIHPLDLTTRHVTGDWGDLDAEDHAVNETALLSGARIFSVYGARGSDDCLWVITEAQDDAGRRSATTILRPDDY